MGGPRRPRNGMSRRVEQITGNLSFRDSFPPTPGPTSYPHRAFVPSPSSRTDYPSAYPPPRQVTPHMPVVEYGDTPVGQDWGRLFLKYDGGHWIVELDSSLDEESCLVIKENAPEFQTHDKPWHFLFVGDAAAEDSLRWCSDYFHPATQDQRSRHNIIDRLCSADYMTRLRAYRDCSKWLFRIILRASWIHDAKSEGIFLGARVNWNNHRVGFPFDTRRSRDRTIFQMWELLSVQAHVPFEPGICTCGAILDTRSNAGSHLKGPCGELEPIGTSVPHPKAGNTGGGLCGPLGGLADIFPPPVSPRTRASAAPAPAAPASAAPATVDMVVTPPARPAGLSPSPSASLFRGSPYSTTSPYPLPSSYGSSRHPSFVPDTPERKLRRPSGSPAASSPFNREEPDSDNEYPLDLQRGSAEPDMAFFDSTRRLLSSPSPAPIRRTDPGEQTSSASGVSATRATEHVSAGAQTSLEPTSPDNWAHSSVKYATSTLPIRRDDDERRSTSPVTQRVAANEICIQQSVTAISTPAMAFATGDSFTSSADSPGAPLTVLTHVAPTSSQNQVDTYPGSVIPAATATLERTALPSAGPAPLVVRASPSTLPQGNTGYSSRTTTSDHRGIAQPPAEAIPAPQLGSDDATPLRVAPKWKTAPRPIAAPAPAPAAAPTRRKRKKSAPVPVLGSQDVDELDHVDDDGDVKPKIAPEAAELADGAVVGTPASSRHLEPSVVPRTKRARASAPSTPSKTPTASNSSSSVASPSFAAAASTSTARQASVTMIQAAVLSKDKRPGEEVEVAPLGKRRRSAPSVPTLTADHSRAQSASPQPANLLGLSLQESTTISSSAVGATATLATVTTERLTSVLPASESPAEPHNLDAGTMSLDEVDGESLARRSQRNASGGALAASTSPSGAGAEAESLSLLYPAKVVSASYEERLEEAKQRKSRAAKQKIDVKELLRPGTHVPLVIKKLEEAYRAEESADKSIAAYRKLITAERLREEAMELLHQSAALDALHHDDEVASMPAGDSHVPEAAALTEQPSSTTITTTSGRAKPGSPYQAEPRDEALVHPVGDSSDVAIAAPSLDESEIEVATQMEVEAMDVHAVTDAGEKDVDAELGQEGFAASSPALADTGSTAEQLSVEGILDGGQPFQTCSPSGPGAPASPRLPTAGLASRTSSAGNHNWLSPALLESFCNMVEEDKEYFRVVIEDEHDIYNWAERKAKGLKDEDGHNPLSTRDWVRMIGRYVRLEWPFDNATILPPPPPSLENSMIQWVWVRRDDEEEEAWLDRIDVQRDRPFDVIRKERRQRLKAVKKEKKRILKDARKEEKRLETERKKQEVREQKLRELKLRELKLRKQKEEGDEVQHEEGAEKRNRQEKAQKEKRQPRATAKGKPSAKTAVVTRATAKKRSSSKD